jgi:hypothetical protein
MYHDSDMTVWPNHALRKPGRGTLANSFTLAPPGAITDVRDISICVQFVFHRWPNIIVSLDVSLLATTGAKRR